MEGHDGCLLHGIGQSRGFERHDVGGHGNSLFVVVNQKKMASMEEILNRIRTKVTTKVAECNAAAGPVTPVQQKCDELREENRRLKRGHSADHTSAVEAQEYFVSEKITSAEDINEMLWKEGKQDEASLWIPKNVFVRVDEASPVDGRPLFDITKRLYKRSQLLVVLQDFNAKRIEAFERWARGQKIQKKQAPYFWSPRMISDVEKNALNWEEGGYDDPPSVHVEATDPVFSINADEVERHIKSVYAAYSELESSEGVKLTMSVVEGGDKEGSEQKEGGGETKSVDISQYEKMLKIGLPLGAVQQKMKRDGVDPGLLEGGGEKLQLSFGKSPKCNVRLFKMRAKGGAPKEDLISQMLTINCTPEQIAEVFPSEAEEKKTEEGSTVTIRLPSLRVDYSPPDPDNPAFQTLTRAVDELKKVVSKKDGIESITMSVNGERTDGYNMVNFSKNAKEAENEYLSLTEKSIQNPGSFTTNCEDASSSPPIPFGYEPFHIDLSAGGVSPVQRIKLRVKAIRKAGAGDVEAPADERKQEGSSQSDSNVRQIKSWKFNPETKTGAPEQVRTFLGIEYTLSVNMLKLDDGGMPVVARSVPPIFPTLQMAEAIEVGPKADIPVSDSGSMMETSHFSTQKRMPVTITIANEKFLCDWKISHPSSGGDNPLERGALHMRAAVDEGDRYDETLRKYIRATVVSYMKNMFTYWGHILYPKSVQNSVWDMALYWAFGNYTNANGEEVVEEKPPSVRVAQSFWERSPDDFTMVEFVESKEFDAVPEGMKIYLAMNYLGRDVLDTMTREIEGELLSLCSIPTVVADNRENVSSVIRKCLDALYSLFKQGLFVPRRNFIGAGEAEAYTGEEENGAWSSWEPFLWKTGRMDMLKMFVCLIHNPDSFMTMRELGASKDEHSPMKVVLNSLKSMPPSRDRLTDEFESAKNVMVRAEKTTEQIEKFKAEESFKLRLEQIKTENNYRMTQAAKQKMTDRSVLMKLALPCDFYTAPKSFYKSTTTSFSRNSEAESSISKFLTQMRKGNFSSLMYNLSTPEAEETKEEPAVVVQGEKVEKLPLPDTWVKKYNNLKRVFGAAALFRLKNTMAMAGKNPKEYDLSVLSGGEDTFDGIRARLRGGNDPALFESSEAPQDQLSPFFERLLTFFPANEKRCWVGSWLKAEQYMNEAFKNKKSVSSEYESDYKKQWEGMYKLFAHQTSVLADKMKQRDSHVMYSVETKSGESSDSGATDVDWKNMFAYRNGSLVNIYNTFLAHLETVQADDEDDEWDPDA